MAPAIPFIMAAATVVSTVAAIKGARDAKKQRNAQAAIEEENRRRSEEETAFRLQQQKRQNYLRLGSIRAAAGASRGGTTGSALDVLGDVARQGELERGQIQRTGDAEAFNYSARAGLYRAAGKAEYQAGMLSAAGTLLGGATSTYQAKLEYGS